MPPIRIARLVADADRALTGIEDDTLDRILGELRAAEANLEREITRRWAKARAGLTDLDLRDQRAAAEARARELLAQVRGQLHALELGRNGIPVNNAMMQAVKGSYETGLSSATALINAYDAALTMSVNVSALPIRMVAENAAGRLYRHSTDAITKIETEVIQGLIRGEGAAKVRDRIRRVTGYLEYEAERIARTETISAADEARRLAYADTGVEYVQRIATQDTRVCGYCAARAGNVYPRDEAPAALHPNDRCFNAPWKPEWQTNGLTNDEWLRSHRATAEAKAQKGGDKLRHGRAPFERMEDRPRPKPIWTPKSGYTAEWGRPAGRR